MNNVSLHSLLPQFNGQLLISLDDFLLADATPLRIVCPNAHDLDMRHRADRHLQQEAVIAEDRVMGDDLLRHRDDLTGYSISKGKIRFDPAKPMPATLIRKLVKTRIAENAGRKAKAAAGSTRGR